ncbi:MAG TPA: PilZ domain-containing protein, partial [Pyrinomonadaceae bacterium]|nr:PilZ domain-containing protein [Pyrinomonadaceae bacterium]
KKTGKVRTVILSQISVGGCLSEWDPSLYTGEEFRLEIELPNGNRLPIRCKAIYRFENMGVGVKFLDMTKFEQSLLSQIITSQLEDEGLPSGVDVFAWPAQFSESDALKLTDYREKREEMLEEIMSSD